MPVTLYHSCGLLQFNYTYDSRWCSLNVCVCELGIYSAHIKCVNRTNHIIYCHWESELGEQI